MSKDYVAIIDYGSGNLRSAAKAFEHVIAERGLDVDVRITSAPDDLDGASHIVLPGQGAFADCMRGLRASGMLPALEANVLERKAPFLGICVGMQLLADKGFEHGEHEGLGWISGDVVPMSPDDKALKIPHMGWNIIDITALNAEPHPVLKGVNSEDHYYFVHSFMFQCKEERNVLAKTSYGGDVTAIIADANIIGVQFHPEKSQKSGMKLLHNFLTL